MSKRPAQTGAQGANKRPAVSDVVFRVLVPERRVGLVIGARGANIKRLRETTGARVRVVDAVNGCDERVIIIASRADQLDRNGVCAAQSALVSLGVQEAPEFSQETPTVRLLICKSHAGYIIGKQGGIIKQMCLETGANMKVLPENQVPCCALTNDRLLQVVASGEAMERGLRAIAEKVQSHQQREMPGEPRMEAIKEAARAAAAAG